MLQLVPIIEKADQRVKWLLHLSRQTILPPLFSGASSKVRKRERVSNGRVNSSGVAERTNLRLDTRQIPWENRKAAGNWLWLLHFERDRCWPSAQELFLSRSSCLPRASQPIFGTLKPEARIFSTGGKPIWGRIATKPKAKPAEPQNSIKITPCALVSTLKL